MNGTANGVVGNDSLIRQNPGANALSAKAYEERLKLPVQRDSSDDATMKVRSKNLYKGMERVFFPQLII